MAIRHVVVEGDEILRKKCREVTEVTDRIKMTLEDMLETNLQELGQFLFCLVVDLAA